MVDVDYHHWNHSLVTSRDVNHSPTVLHHVTALPTTAWTRVNAAEALPGLLTPLGWTFWDERVELALRGAFADMGVLRTDEVVVHPDVDHRFTAIFYGRFTGNLDMLRECADRTPGTSASALEQQMFGSVRPEVSDHPTRRRWPAIAAKMPRAAVFIGKRLTDMRRDTDRWWRTCTTTAMPGSEDEARTMLLEAGDRFQTVFRAHLLNTFLCQAVFEQLTAVAESAGRQGLELKLATGYGGMEEGRILHDLWEVSRARRSLERFLADHGYHGFSEGDVAQTSWRENPGTLTKLIESYRQRAEDQDPDVGERKRSVERSRAEAELLGALGLVGRSRAGIVLRLAARHIPLREVGKMCFLQAIDVGRCASKVLGTRLAARGAIAAPEDVYFLTYEELRAGVTTEVHAMISDRRRLLKEYAALEIPRTWVGQPRPTPVALAEADSPAAVGGLPVYPGVVEGRVVVVDDPEDVILNDGEVLVCQFTDPSWVALMGLAAALVIDVGGPISHGAIVARELAIPTIINTGNGTRVLRTGDRVRVDAGRGTVDLLERPDRVSDSEPS